MVRLKKLKISSNDIANINYTILLNTKHGSASFEELWDLPIFQSMVAYPFNNVQKTKKMGLVRRKVSNLLQLEDSDFPPKGERASVFSEPVWDEYMKRFIKKIGEQEVMYIVNALVQADYLQMKKPTEKNPYVDKEYQFLSINARNRLTEDNTTLENLESNLGKILGYEYEQGTQETKKKDNDLMNAIDAEKPVLFPDVLKEHIEVSGSGDELKVRIDTQKYFEKLFKDYGFGDINEENWDDKVKLTDKDGKPKLDEAGKQKTGRRFTGNFQFPMAEIPKGEKRENIPGVKDSDKEHALSEISRIKEEGEYRETFEIEEGETVENEFRESTDIEEFIPFINSQGKKDERKNPEWDKAFDELADEKFKEWRLERQEEEEEDLEQYDEDDEYETAEKMLKAIEIAKAVFKPTQQKTIKHILKIMPKSDFKRIKPTPKPKNKDDVPTPSTYADRKQGLDRHEYSAMSFQLDDWDSTHTYDDLDELHEAVQEIEFNERDIKNWIMKLIQGQRKSELKNLVLGAITFNDNILYLGSVEFTLVRYEYDTVDDLELALHGSIEPTDTEEFEEAKEAIGNQLAILQGGYEKLADYMGETKVMALFNQNKKEMISSLMNLTIKINEDLQFIEKWKDEETAEEPGNYRKVMESPITDKTGRVLFFDMADEENKEFMKVAEDPKAILPKPLALPKSKKYGNWEWAKTQFDTKINNETKEEELVNPKIGGQTRFQQINNKSMSWASEVLVEADKLSMMEQEDALLEMKKTISNPKKKGVRMPRANRGMVEILDMGSLKRGKLNLDVDFVGLWLDFTKGMQLSEILAEIEEPEFESAIEEELLRTSWKNKVTREGNTEKNSGVILPVIAHKNLDHNDKIKIDTRTHQVRGTSEFKDTRSGTRFARQGIGRRDDKIIVKDMSTLKKIISEFRRMQSMVS